MCLKLIFWGIVSYYHFSSLCFSRFWLVILSTIPLPKVCMMIGSSNRDQNMLRDTCTQNTIPWWKVLPLNCRTGKKLLFLPRFSDDATYNHKSPIYSRLSLILRVGSKFWGPTFHISEIPYDQFMQPWVRCKFLSSLSYSLSSK